MIEIKVGSKGELFLPKFVRTKLNLNPGDKLFLDLNDDMITIKKIPSLDELLDKPFISNKISVSDSNKMIKEMQDNQISQSLDETNE